MKTKKSKLLLFKKTSIIELSKKNAVIIIGGGYHDKTSTTGDTSGSDGRTTPTRTGDPTHTDPSAIEPPLSGPKNP